MQKFHTNDTAQPIRSSTQIWVVMGHHHHQHGISALVSQTSFCGKTVGGTVTCLLFFEAISLDDFIFINFSALKQNNYYSSCKKLDGPPIHHKVFLKLPLSSTLTRPHMESTTMLFCPSMGGLSPVIKSIKPS